MDPMEHALALARKAVAYCSPNPPVGALLIKDGAIVGEGWTQPPGQAHAEIVALAKAGHNAKGATLFVTLEPCCYQGRTPPCTKTIIESGVAEAHIALIDPNPLVKGKGIAELQKAGIKVHLYTPQQEAIELIEAHEKYITSGLPFVMVKYAMSLDGKIATSIGDSKWITGPEARQYVHRLRAAADAIMVGVNTILHDDPKLTARDSEDLPLSRQPLRVIVDSQGRTPVTANALKEPGRTLIVTATKEHIATTKAPASEILCLPSENSQVDIKALLKHLGHRGIANLLVEGGGTLISTLFELSLVDKVIAFVSPIIIGGKNAPSPVEGRGADKIAEALRLNRVRVEHFGQDVAIIGYCKA